MVQQDCQGEATNSENPLKGGNRPDAEARADFWSIQGDFICRHHNEPRVQLHVPKDETFPVPLKYIDVIRSTQTDQDVFARETY